MLSLILLSCVSSSTVTELCRISETGDSNYYLTKISRKPYENGKNVPRVGWTSPRPLNTQVTRVELLESLQLLFFQKCNLLRLSKSLFTTPQCRLLRYIRRDLLRELHSKRQMAADETLPIRFQSQIWPGLRTQVLAISIFYHIYWLQKSANLHSMRIVCDQLKEISKTILKSTRPMGFRKV